LYRQSPDGKIAAGFAPTAPDFGTGLTLRVGGAAGCTLASLCTAGQRGEGTAFAFEWLAPRPDLMLLSSNHRLKAKPP
jgi:hypothetical protein